MNKYRSAGILVAAILAIIPSQVGTAETYDLVILNGRVMDPESGLDAIRNVGVKVGYWAADAAGAPVEALEETAEADAYATSLQQASEIAVNAARRPGLELVTSRLYPNAEADVMSNRGKAFVATELPLKIVPRPQDDRPSRHGAKP